MDWSVVGPTCALAALGFALVDRVRKNGKDEAASEARTIELSKRVDAIEVRVSRLDDDKASRAELAALADRLKDKITATVARFVLPHRDSDTPPER
jgi:cell division protein FtsB